MGCGASSVQYEEAPPPRAQMSSQSSSSKSSSRSSEREREAKRQHNIAINQERPMAWLFKYPDPHGQPPRPEPTSAPHGRHYSTKNSRTLGSQHSGTSATLTPEDDVDPWLPGPYVNKAHMTPLHIANKRARG